MHTPGSHDPADRPARLSATGDPLEALALDGAIDFEVFHPVLLDALDHGDRAKGGRPPCAPVTMFQGAGSGLDARPERPADGVSYPGPFQPATVPGVSIGEPTPDAKTIRPFREKPTRAVRSRRCSRPSRSGRAIAVAGPRVGRSGRNGGPGPTPAHGRGREGARQGGRTRVRHPARRSRQGRAEGHRHALDVQVFQGPEDRRRRSGCRSGGYLRAAVRLPDPHRHRPEVALHPRRDMHARGPAWRPRTGLGPGPGRQLEFHPGVHGPTLDRRRSPGPSIMHPPREAVRQAHARAHPPGRRDGNPSSAPASSVSSGMGRAPWRSRRARSVGRGLPVA